MNAVEPIRDREILKEFEEKMKALGEREHILYLLGIYTGLRITDLINLKIKDVKKEYITLIEKKTGKEKKMLINPNLKRELKKYIEGKDEEQYILKSKKGQNKAITRQRAWQLMKKIAESIGLESIGCHTLRKTFGYHYYKKTGDIVTLQKIYNHSVPSTTVTYVGIEQDEMDKAIKNMDFRF